MRKKIVAGNWKMNLLYQEGVSLFSEILSMVKDETRGNQQVVVCCPFIHLHHLAQQTKTATNIFIGAQNLSQEEKGAFTGEVSAGQIRSTGATHVIIGHSERRAYFHEDSAILIKKLNKALEHGLSPIFCIGESKEDRESDSYFEVLKKQLEEVVFNLSNSDISKVVLAYEPIWAIGTGLTASPEQAQEVHAFIREAIAQHFNEDVAQSMTILYGGSCNPTNAAEIFAQPDIDGGLIGGASLKSRDFMHIVNVLNA